MVARIKVEGASRLQVEHILEEWRDPFMAAFSKRAASTMRGRSRYAVRRRTGALRKSVRASHTTSRSWGRRASVGGEIGQITLTSEIAGSPADQGYFAFVEKAARRWARSEYARRTAHNIGNRIMRKTAARQNARTAAAGR